MSYSLYNFTLTLNGNYYELTFSTPSLAKIMSLPSLVYVNSGTATFEIDRFSPLLVHIGDGNGITTVDWSRCTSFVAVSASNFIANVLALLP